VNHHVPRGWKQHSHLNYDLKFYRKILSNQQEEITLIQDMNRPNVNNDMQMLVKASEMRSACKSEQDEIKMVYNEGDTARRCGIRRPWVRTRGL
jgi:hypothetical protein